MRLESRDHVIHLVVRELLHELLHELHGLSIEFRIIHQVLRVPMKLFISWSLQIKHAVIWRLLMLHA